VEATLIGLAIEADAGVVGHFAAFVDDRPGNRATAADLGVRQDDGTVDGVALLDPHVGKQQRLAHHGAGDDAAARHHGVDGHAAADRLRPG